jgi:hypothetical protein
MKDTLRVSAAVLVLLGAGCGTKPVVWQKIIDTGSDETATALASDGANYYLSFVATRPGGSDRAGWFITKLDSTGKEVWTQMYKGSPYAICEDVWADNFGHLFAAGRSRAEGKDICLVIRYAAGGEVTWQKGLALGDKTWATGVCPVSGDRIASDTHDNLALVGLHGANAANPDIVIIKLAPNGDTLWTRRYDSGGADEPGDVAFDGFGNIVANGTARSGDSVRCVILDYDPDGNLIHQLAYGTAARATGKGIYVTKGSDVYVAGSLLTAGGKSEILAFQYKPSAVAVWEEHYSPGPSASGVDLVVNGDVYTAATVQGKTKDALVCRFRQLAAPRSDK